MWKLLGVSDAAAAVIKPLATLVIFALLGAAVWLAGYNSGVGHEQQKAAKKQVVAATAKATQAASAASSAVAAATVYVNKVRTVYKTGATIIKEVPVYVPASAPELPPGFRVLHDAAAVGVEPDSARLATAASVPAKDAISVVAYNYALYHDLAARHDALAGLVEDSACFRGE